MYKQILIATDGSELGSRGVTQGLALAKSLNASVSILTVTEAKSPYETVHDRGRGATQPVKDCAGLARGVAKRILDEARERAAALNIECECVHVPDQTAADGIIAAAEKTGADLIVMASHGYRGVERLLFGSKASEVASRSHVPVLIVR
jgi:nucleotide-binding universal stress UspA family protein